VLRRDGEIISAKLERHKRSANEISTGSDYEC